MQISIPSSALLRGAEMLEKAQCRGMDRGRELARRVIAAAARKRDISLTALAEDAGLAQSTLTRFMNSEAATTIPSMKTLVKVARAAGCTIEALLAWDLAQGETSGTLMRQTDDEDAPGRGVDTPGAGAYSEGGMVKVHELDVRATAGFSGIDPAVYKDNLPILAEWIVPRKWVEQVAPGPAPNLKILRAIGDSMLPDIQPGQRVLVDIADTTPSPPGVFVLWDGLSFVIKQVEFIPLSDPHRVVISSKNPDYPPREYLLGDIYIQARVVGTWKAW